MAYYKAAADRLYFKDWCMPDPDSEHLGEALYAVFHREFGEPTREQLSLIATAAEAYQHLAGHPTEDEGIIAQLRLLRRAVRAERNKRRRAAHAPPPALAPRVVPTKVER